MSPTASRSESWRRVGLDGACQAADERARSAGIPTPPVSLESRSAASRLTSARWPTGSSWWLRPGRPEQRSKVDVEAVAEPGEGRQCHVRTGGLDALEKPGRHLAVVCSFFLGPARLGPQPLDVASETERELAVGLALMVAGARAAAALHGADRRASAVLWTTTYMS